MNDVPPASPGGTVAPPTGPTVRRGIFGTVVDENGQPVAGATVTARAGRAASRQTSQTDANGRFGIWVQIGTTTQTVTVTIEADGHSTKQVTVPLGEGETVVTAAILPPLGGGNPANAVPSLSNMSTDPDALDFTGGTTQLACRVVDPEGDALTVVAVVSDDNAATIVQLAGSGPNYTGTFTAPANYGDGAANKEYKVFFCATDMNQSVTAGPVIVTQRGYSSPPGMPDDLN